MIAKSGQAFKIHLVTSSLSPTPQLPKTHCVTPVNIHNVIFTLPLPLLLIFVEEDTPLLVCGMTKTSRNLLTPQCKYRALLTPRGFSVVSCLFAKGIWNSSAYSLVAGKWIRLTAGKFPTLGSKNRPNSQSYHLNCCTHLP